MTTEKRKPIVLIVGHASSALAAQLAAKLLPQADLERVVVSTDPQDVEAIEAGSMVFLTGVDDGTLVPTCERALARDLEPILVVDALRPLQTTPEAAKDFTSALGHLVEKRVQTTVSAQVPGLVKMSRLMHYSYPKADSTTTLLVVIDSGTADAAVLTIERARAPFKDMLSFPGGFLDPHLESLPGCSSREASEETHLEVPPEALELVDVRSNPERDERGHVIDHGYLWRVPAGMRARVLAAIKAGDDAKADSTRFTRVATLLAAGESHQPGKASGSRVLAFDHMDLLLEAQKRYALVPPRSLFRRLAHRLGRYLLSL